VFNTYQQGTGLDLDETNAFNILDLRNDNAFPIAFQIFVGFDAYIDNRLILSGGQPVVAFPTYDTPNSLAAVAIPDRSGSVIADINGNQFYALSRVAVLVFNTDAGVTLLVQRAGSAIPNGPAVGAVYPQTSVRLDCAGDFSLSTGGGNINCVVSELYNAIPR
jgi:hypothetical protein